MPSRKLALFFLSVFLCAALAVPATFAGDTAATRVGEDGPSFIAEKAAAVLSGEVLNPLAAEIVSGGPVEAAEGGPRNTYSVPLRLRIPWDRITLEESGEELRGELRFALAARDRRGRDADLREIVLPLRVTREEPSSPEAFFEYDLALELRSGKHLVALVLRDELGETMSYARYSLRVVQPTDPDDLRHAFPVRNPTGGLKLYPSVDH